MFKILCTILVSILTVFTASAKAKQVSQPYQIPIQYRHEIKVSWGDQIFESLNWRNSSYIVNTLPESEILTYNENYKYTQHWSLEYFCRAKSWLSAGIIIDGSACIWDSVRRNGLGVEQSRLVNESFTNIAIVPTVRFTYLNRKYVNLYSGIGIGLNINTGSEIDYKDRHTALAPAINITYIGIKVIYGRCFAAFELGGLFAANGSHEVYMFNSRALSAGIGVSF